MSVKSRIAELNARLADSLTAKGVEADGSETTTALIDKVDNLQVGGSKWEELFNLSTNNGTDYSYLLHSTTDLDTAPELDYSQVISTEYMFASSGTNELVIPHIEMPKVTSVRYMFNNTTAAYIGGLTTSDSVTVDVYAMCQNSKGIKKIGELNIPNITNNNFVFSYCTELTEIEGISGVFLSGGNNVFGNTGKLTTLGEIYGDITGTVKVNSSPLDLPTAKRIIEALKNYAGTSKEGVYSVTFSTTTLGYLEAEGATAPNDMTWIDYANAKGWNI